MSELKDFLWVIIGLLSFWTIRPHLTRRRAVIYRDPDGYSWVRYEYR